MNILLTGGTGFLGQNLARALAESGHLVRLIVRDVAKAKQTIGEAANITYLKGDITQKNLGLEVQQLQQLENTIDAFYHSAACVKFYEEMRDEIMQTNVRGTKNAVDVAEKIKAKKFHYISTAYTVGSGERNLTGKEHIYDGNQTFSNPYEESKHLAEKVVWKARNKLAVCIFRPSVIVGDSKTGEAQSKFTIYGVARLYQMFKDVLQKNGEPNQLRYFLPKNSSINLIPVDYVTNVLVRGLTASSPGEIYNVTTNTNTSSFFVMERIKESTAFTKVVHTDQRLDRLNPLEQQLKKKLQLVESYLNNQITFENHNTLALMKKKSLNMSDKEVDVIFNNLV